MLLIDRIAEITEVRLQRLQVEEERMRDIDKQRREAEVCAGARRAKRDISKIDEIILRRVDEGLEKYDLHISCEHCVIELTPENMGYVDELIKHYTKQGLEVALQTKTANRLSLVEAYTEYTQLLVFTWPIKDAC